MSSREVMREEWGPFFDAFSGTHEGWLGSVEVFDGGQRSALPQVHNLPLEGVSADFERDTTLVTISFGGSPDLHIEHTVSAPTHVWIRKSEEAREDTLELETAHGVTLVRLRAAASEGVAEGPDPTTDMSRRRSTP